MRTLPRPDQLEAFVTTADAGSFSAAARQLEKAQSAVSTAVANLEIDLGLQLFDRSGKYPVVTPVGESLLREARRMLADLSFFTMRAARLAEGVESRLVLALEPVLPGDAVCRILSGFAKRFPETDLEVIEATLDEAHGMVEAGRADLGIIVPFELPVLAERMRLLGYLQFLAAVAPSHPLAGKKRMMAADLREFLQLLVVTRSGFREPAQPVLGKTAWWVENPFRAMDMIRAGIGWGSLPEPMIRPEVEAGRLVPLDLELAGAHLVEPVLLVWGAGATGPGALWLREAFGRMEGLGHRGAE